MNSIRSILIKTCMANVQKEMSQLEHWLNNLPDEPPQQLNQQLSQQLSQQQSQQLIINNILERLDRIESNRDSKKDIWIGDDCSEIVSEPLFTINKKDFTDFVDSVNEVVNVTEEVDEVEVEVEEVDEVTDEVEVEEEEVEEEVEEVVEEEVEVKVEPIKYITITNVSSRRSYKNSIKISFSFYRNYLVVASMIIR